MSRYITETNYNTVLDRIFIRAEIDGKWKSISLRHALYHQEQLKEWIIQYCQGRELLPEPLNGATAKVKLDGEISENDLIALIKTFDNVGVPPVRLKEED